MSEMQWEEPPRAHQHPKDGGGRHAEIAAQLREHPARWAKVFTFSEAEKARSMAYCISHAARMKAYEPAGAFEAISRKVGNETCVYARYVGGEGS